jgi:CHAD domain-containing protein
MVKLSDLKFVKADMPFPVAALELLAEQTGIIRKLYRKLYRGYTEELLHDTRVNLRRLQALLSEFRKYLIEKKEQQIIIERHLRIIRNMINLLSKTRTYEVSSNIINDYAGSIPQSLTLNILAGEVRVQKVKSLDKMYKSVLFNTYGNEIKNLCKLLDSDIRKNIPEEIKSISFSSIYHDIIVKEFEKSISSADVVFFPSDMTEQIHKYRIALKSLRYLTEIGEGHFGDDFDRIKDEIRNLVELLGTFNDYNTVLGLSEKLIQEESLKNTAYFDFMFYLRQNMLAIYDEVFVSLKLLKSENPKLIFKNNKIVQ